MSWPGRGGGRLGGRPARLAIGAALLLGLTAVPAGADTLPIGGTFLAEPTDDGAAAVVFQGARRVLVAGRSRCLSHFCEYGALARYSLTGKLDPSFGQEGRVGGEASGLSAVRALAVQPDGAIVAGGTVASSGVPGEAAGGKFALARYLPDGALDPSFGDGGVVRTDFCLEPAAGAANALAIQPDGRILAAGFARCGTNRLLAIVRYRPDGTLDRSFRGGWVAIDGGPALHEEFRAIALRPDRRILVAGGANGDLLIFQLKPSGQTDSSFAHDGTAYTRLTVVAGRRGKRRRIRGVANGIALDERGRILIAGGRNGVIDFGVVSRYLPSGRLDPGFASHGTTTVHDLTPLGLARGRCGEIELAGVSSPQPRIDTFAVGSIAADGGRAKDWLQRPLGTRRGSAATAIAVRGRLAVAVGAAPSLSGYGRFALAVLRTSAGRC